MNAQQFLEHWEQGEAAENAGSASCVVEVKCSKCKWGGRFSMNPSKPEELKKRIAVAHAYAKTGWQCDGKLTWTPKELNDE
jgi:hypothetical protein